MVAWIISQKLVFEALESAGTQANNQRVQFEHVPDHAIRRAMGPQVSLGLAIRSYLLMATIGYRIICDQITIIGNAGDTVGD